MADTIISVENLGKLYRIRHQQSRRDYATLRDLIAEKAKGLFKKLKFGKLKSGNNAPVSASQKVSVSVDTFDVSFPPPPSPPRPNLRPSDGRRCPQDG